MGMRRIYSNPDPHGAGGVEDLLFTLKCMREKRTTTLQGRLRGVASAKEVGPLNFSKKNNSHPSSYII
jgi:hypothetical protein